MKKIYQSPATKLVTVKVTHLMDQSLHMTGNPASVNTETYEYNTLSRRGSSLWDDDADE
ncbi:MAG: hypothetical protein IJ887_01755 [Prevotella sp.]|nr:hypothetical protein [Prevotella sp.]